MFNNQHKEHVQISNVSNAGKTHISGNFLGNEHVRINKVSLYYNILYFLFWFILFTCILYKYQIGS